MIFHNKTLKNSIPVFLLYLCIGIVVFWKVPFAFFQQDEWAVFGNFIYWNTGHLNWFERLVVYGQYSHFAPISNIISYLQFVIFHLNFFYYSVSDIFMHLINAFLVYIFSSIIFEKKKISMLAGLIFLVSSIPSQAFTWVGTAVGTAGSVMVFLLSLIFFALFLRKKAHTKLYLFFSALFLFISLFCNEISLFSFLFYPVFWFIFKDKKSIKKLLLVVFPFFSFGVLFVLIRVVVFIIGNATNQSVPEGLTEPTNPIIYLFRILTIPLKSIAQSIVPQEYIIKAADTVLVLGYPHFVVNGSTDPYVSQTIGSDMITFFLALIVIFLSILAAKYFQNRKQLLYAKAIIISLVFIGLSSLPFIFIPGAAGYFSLFDGRHLYLTNVFTAILLSLLFYAFIEKFYRKKIIVGIGILVLLAFIFANSLKIRRDMNEQISLGNTRKTILTRISDLHPTFPQKIVFYTESDTAYYGLADTEKIMPFQTGFGQNLLVWYAVTKNQYLPSCFYKDLYLYKIESEGYQECDGRGFGYFRKIDSLKNALSINKLSKDDVIAFRYNSHTHILEDITNAVRKNL